jgi:hypothetical protein
MVSNMPWPLYSLQRQQVPIVQDTGQASRLVWMCLENHALTGVKPQTVQCIASRYIDCAITATHLEVSTVVK